MNIRVTLSGQLKRAAGFSEQRLILAQGADDTTAIRRLAESGPEPLRRILLTESDSVQPTLLRFVNDQMVPTGQCVVLQDGDELAVMTPISGG